MVNTKAVVILIVASVFVAAVAGIAFAQYVGAQINGANNMQKQTPQGATSIAQSPQQGYYPSGSTQNGYACG